jgi:signal transduction histidine kinase
LGNRGSLRRRLGIAYATTLIGALLAFAAAALLAVDREQRSALDAQLRAIGGASSIVGDLKNGRFSVDAKDRQQFFTILGARAQSAIVTNGGTVAVSTDDATAHALFAALAPVTRPAYADLRGRGGRLRIFAEPLVEDGLHVGTALAWRDTEAIAALDRRVALAFLIVIPLVAVLAIVAGDTIARRGLEPLERVVSLAADIEAEDLSQRLGDISRDVELSRLAATIDRMLDRLECAFDRERRFTSDASHELRAPLSVIRAEADLALRSEREPSEYRRALETIASEADALEALTRDLLAAARGGEGREEVREPVDLAEVATLVAGRFASVAGSRRIRVADAPGLQALVSANRALLERALVSAVHNALKYASEGGAVAIDVRAENGSAAITVADDGPGFTPAGLQRALDRFWRDDEARTRDGAGLGLAIAKSIVERYGGTIAVANAQPHGAIVRMSFPRLV